MSVCSPEEVRFKIQSINRTLDIYFLSFQTDLTAVRMHDTINCLTYLSTSCSYQTCQCKDLTFTYIEGNILEKGKMALDAKLFSEITRKLSDGDSGLYKCGVCRYCEVLSRKNS